MCFLDDGRVYDIEFKKDDEKDSITIYDKEIKNIARNESRATKESTGVRSGKKLEQEIFERRLNIVFGKENCLKSRIESIKHKLLGTGTKVIMTANRDKSDAFSIIGLEIREDDDKLFQFSSNFLLIF